MDRFVMCCSSSGGDGGSWFLYDALIENDQVKSGDMIEILRSQYRHYVHFRHWVLVHDYNDLFNSYMCYHIKAVGQGEIDEKKEREFKAKLIYEPLSDIVGKSYCRINNQETEASNRAKRVENYREPSLWHVFQALDQQLDKYVDYNVNTHNCENYVTFWKYGIKSSVSIGWSH